MKPVGVALEPQNAHAVNAGARKPIAKAGGHRAKILANDDGAVPVRFERSQPQQIVERIGEIGALARPRRPVA